MLLHIDNHLEAQRAGLAVTAGRDARMFDRRLRAAIRDNVVSKRRAAELLARLNAYRRRDDPWSLDMFLNDYRYAMEACCKRYARGACAISQPIPDARWMAQAGVR